MSGVAPLDRDQLPELEPLFENLQNTLGFIPNSLLIMAHLPSVMQAFGGLANAVQMGGTLPRGLKQLVAFVSSQSSGCIYCQAHTSHGAQHAGIPAEKIQAAFEFESSPLFEPAERAALRLARDASLVPNCVENEHFEALKEHYTDEEICELVAVISLFGWLNRWNDTLATQIETVPRQFAEQNLGARGWQPSKHAD
ncbi:carboxymuconolactone decarboxylase family protein [Myxococcota bacterium]|nr:carboxymuconolactone decarboxylase family protein [Myxococcota bacterium]